MNLRIFDSAADAVAACAAAIVQRVEAYAKLEGSDSLRRSSVALSGGSSPIPLHTRLGAPPLRDTLAALPIDWVVVDERYVPESDPESNSGMIRRTLFANGIAPGHRFLRFRTEENDPQRTAAEFEKEWNALGIDQLTVVVLGVGDDGHTASLFPGTTSLDVDKHVATEVFVPRLDAWRVTITAPVIRAANLRIVLAPGASKREIIGKIREGGDYPITRVTAGLETWWFVDRAAVE